MAILAIYKYSEQFKDRASQASFFHAVKLFHARGYALEVSLAPPSYGYLKVLLQQTASRGRWRKEIFTKMISISLF